jgi:two-component system chemotaxis sensor kinase CheA
MSLEGRVAALIEDLAELCVEAEPCDKVALSRARLLATELDHEIGSHAAPEVAAALRTSLELLKVGMSGDEHAASAGLGELGQIVSRLQGERALTDAASVELPAACATAMASNAFLPAEYVDEAILAEFVMTEREAVGALEADVLALDGASAASALASIKRRLHTMKGEGALVGASDLASACHAAEGWLAGIRDPAACVEPLLALGDWLGETVAAYARRALPCEAASDLIARLGIGGRADADRDAAAAPSAEPQAVSGSMTGAPLETRGEAACATAPVQAARRSSAGSGAAGTGSRDAPLAATAGAPGAGDDSVTVSLAQLDRLIETIGELITVEVMLAHAPQLASPSLRPLRNHLGQLTKVSRDLQDIGMRMRMVPLRGTFQKMARLTRDLAKKSGKRVRLACTGETAELDRSIVEQLAQALAHLVRNAIDHGLEPEPERVASGKPAVGTIAIDARHEGGSVVVKVHDDGRGISRERILARGEALGLTRAGETPTDAEVLELVFAPGLSTAEQVTETSGRGVGMDIVRRIVDRLRGRIELSTSAAQGTTFELVLPLTLAVIDGMVVAVGSERYILPTLSIVESVRPDAAMLAVLAGRRELLHLRGETLPLMRLGELLEVPGIARHPTEMLAVILESNGRRVALLVDEVVAQQQAVIRPLGPAFRDHRCLSGAAILADGKVGLIINVDEIGNLATRPAASRPRELSA